MLKHLGLIVCEGRKITQVTAAECLRREPSHLLLHSDFLYVGHQPQLM
jgi:hypothetical protein